MVDFQIGTVDSLFGKIHAIPKSIYIGCHNSSHDRLRPTEPLIHLRHADRILRNIDQLADDVAEASNRPPEAARNIAVDLYSREMSRKFGRLPDTKALKSTLVRQQYNEDPILKPEAQGQIAEFRAAFESNSDKRAYFEPRLFSSGTRNGRLQHTTRAANRSIRKCTEISAFSPDQFGHKKHYATATWFQRDRLSAISNRQAPV